MKKIMTFALMIGMSLMLSVSASAYMVLDKWTFDFTGIDGLGAITINNVQQITYFGIAHSTTTDTNGDFLPTPGEFGTTDGLLTATQLINNGGSVILPLNSRLGVDYEMTFDFSVDIRHIIPSPGGNTFIHLAPTVPGAVTDGVLDIYIDAFANGGTIASTSTGLGYTDGVKIASFVVKSGDGGVFSFATFDGSDDATFELIWALPGVMLDEFGNDLSLGTLLAITDSNFDGDPTNLGYFSVNQPTGRPDFAVAPGTPVNFNALEDGSARLAVSEPATLLLLGSGLMGIAVFRRRMKR